MIIELNIDKMGYRIDSTDPETLGKWLVEIFSRVTNPGPHTYYQVRAYPSWVPDDSTVGGHSDWINDSRWFHTYNSRNPRQFIQDLMKTLDDIESESGKNS